MAMNTAKAWDATLKKANEELKSAGFEIRVSKHDMEYGERYDVDIFDGKVSECWAHNFEEHEVSEYVNEAWTHARVRATAKTMHTTVYVLTYVGLSESEYQANGYCDTYVFYSQAKAEAKLKELRDAEIENLKAEERDYEILEDDGMVCRIGWCGNTEQLRLQIQETNVDE